MKPKNKPYIRVGLTTELRRKLLESARRRSLRLATYVRMLITEQHRLDFPEGTEKDKTNE